MEADKYGRDPHNHKICTCQFVVMVIITDAGLLGLHVEKSVTIHNYLS